MMIKSAYSSSHPIEPISVYKLFRLLIRLKSPLTQDSELTSPNVFYRDLCFQQEKL